MANSEDIILRTVWDDTDALKGLKGLYDALGKAEKGFEDLKSESDQASQSIGKTLVDSNQKASKEIDNLIKKTNTAARAYEEQQRKINDVALAIVRSNDTAAKFAVLMERISKVKLSGAAADVADLEKEFTELLQTVELTDDQIKVLETNIDDVAAVIGSISGAEFKELANDAEKATGEFLAAKTELRELTKLINSGQLTGEELQRAELRAAELTDTIGDVRNKIKLLASDTRGLDLLVESVNGLGAGFQIVEGAAALYGDESEELQKTLVKLNAVMAIANGLQQAGQILTTKGGIATKIATGFQNAYTFAVGGASGALKVFRLALAATGVGLLVIGLGTLIANFDKVKKAVLDFIPGLDTLDSKLTGIWNSITTTFGNIGDIISDVFSADFSEAYDKARNIGKEARKAYEEGFAQSESNKAKEAIAKDLEDLAKAQRRRAELLEAGGKDSQKVVESAIANELAALRLRNATREEIEEKSFELQLFQVKREKELRDKRQKEIEDFKKRFSVLKDDVFKLSSEFGILSEKEQFDIIKQKTIDQFTNLRAELVKLGKALNQDVTSQVKQIDELLQGIGAREYVPENFEELPKSIEQTTKNLTEFAKKQPAIPFQLKVNIPEKIDVQGSTQIERFVEDLGNNFEEFLSNTLESIFGKQLGEDVGDFLGAAATAVSAFGSILDEATDIQINNIDKQLDRLSERREKAQDELDKELELQKEGLANNVGNKENEVNGLLAQEQRLLREREQLQRESQRRQLLAETVSQTASLITSSIDIIKGFSKIPIIGLGLGIGAVASLFAFFAATKAKAFQATRLYTGADKISDHFGQVAPGGRSDIPGRGEGYRIIDAVTGQDTNVRISGREMLLPESITDLNRDFFINLKNGEYNGIDLAGTLALAKQVKKSLKNKEVNQVINNVVKMPRKQWVGFVNKKGRYGAKLMDIPENGSEIIYFDI